MTSEQVLENCGKYYHSGVSDKARVLSQPSICTRDLYRMMIKCWNKHADSRPSFEEIHIFLKHLSLE